MNYNDVLFNLMYLVDERKEGNLPESFVEELDLLSGKIIRLSEDYDSFLEQDGEYEMDNDNDLLEKLAVLEHEQWCEWSQNVFADLKYFINIIDSYGIKNVLDEDDKEFFNSQIERSKRWGQLWKPYNELSEGMKEEDRKYARKVLEEIKKGAKGIMPKENETKAEHFLNMTVDELYDYFSSELDVGLSNIFIFPKKERIQLRSTFFLSKEMAVLQEFFKDCPMEITYANENIRLTYDISSWDKIIWEE